MLKQRQGLLEASGSIQGKVYELVEVTELNNAEI